MERLVIKNLWSFECEVARLLTQNNYFFFTLKLEFLTSYKIGCKVLQGQQYFSTSDLMGESD